MDKKLTAAVKINSFPQGDPDSADSYVIEKGGSSSSSHQHKTSLRLLAAAAKGTPKASSLPLESSEGSIVRRGGSPSTKRVLSSSEGAPAPPEGEEDHVATPCSSSDVETPRTYQDLIKLARRQSEEDSRQLSASSILRTGIMDRAVEGNHRVTPPSSDLEEGNHRVTPPSSDLMRSE